MATGLAHHPIGLRGRAWVLLPLGLFALLAGAAFAGWRLGDRDPADVLLLLIGLVGSAIAAGAAYWIVQNRINQAQDTLQQIRALESLTESTAALSARLGEGQALLDQLASTASRLLGMDRAIVATFDEQVQGFRTVSSAGYPTSLAGRVFPAEQAPLCYQALTAGAVTIVEDTHVDTRSMNKALMGDLGIRSTMLVPLRVEGRSVGLMAVSSPSPRRIGERHRRLAELIGAQVAVTLVNSRLHQQMTDALVEQDRLLRQRDRLLGVTAAVYRASSLDESLRRIVELAPGALDVDACAVALWVQRGDEMVIAASTPPFEADRGTRFPVNGSNAGRVVRTQQVVIVEDAQSDESLRKYSRSLDRVGSMAYLPLFEADGQAIGTLNLIRHAAGSFSGEQLQLGEIFCTGVSAAIESARVVDRSRRIAESRAMLLRELNHRVKNNLAGIVGLLANRPADLSPDARQWLDRVAGRINMMGRAHELFVGGPQRVTLSDLVDQLLPALSVVKPANVSFRKELESPAPSLPTEKGVALAMILYELCCNAIVHGLGGAEGTLAIRARQAQGRIVVEVIDSGVGCCQPVAVTAGAVANGEGNGNGNGNGDVTVVMECALDRARRRTHNQGWGLRLVEGLVARELRGTFTMRQQHTSGGTVAAVEFPVTTGAGGEES